MRSALPCTLWELLRGAVCAAALAAAPLSASGTTVLLKLDTVYAGGSPNVPAPFATVLLEDIGPNAVRLELSASEKLTKGAVVSGVFLNFGPNTGELLDPGNLQIKHVKGPDAMKISNSKANQYKADFDGLFDLQFEFATAPAQLSATRTDTSLDPGETAVFEIRSDAVKFDALTFFNLSCNTTVSPDCKRADRSGPFAAAAELFNLAGGATAWIASTQEPPPIPLPAAGWLLLSGLAGLGLTARRTRGPAA